jgi:hypothetical protein
MYGFVGQPFSIKLLNEHLLEYYKKLTDVSPEFLINISPILSVIGVTSTTSAAPDHLPSELKASLGMADHAHATELHHLPRKLGKTPICARYI